MHKKSNNCNYLVNNCNKIVTKRGYISDKKFQFGDKIVCGYYTNHIPNHKKIFTENS